MDETPTVWVDGVEYNLETARRADGTPERHRLYVAFLVWTYQRGIAKGRRQWRREHPAA